MSVVRLSEDIYCPSIQPHGCQHLYRGGPPALVRRMGTSPRLTPQGGSASASSSKESTGSNGLIVQRSMQSCDCGGLLAALWWHDFLHCPITGKVAEWLWRTVQVCTLPIQEGVFRVRVSKDTWVRIPALSLFFFFLLLSLVALPLGP